MSKIHLDSFKKYVDRIEKMGELQGKVADMRMDASQEEIDQLFQSIPNEFFSSKTKFDNFLQAIISNLFGGSKRERTTLLILEKLKDQIAKYFKNDEVHLIKIAEPYIFLNEWFFENKFLSIETIIRESQYDTKLAHYFLPEIIENKPSLFYERLLIRNQRDYAKCNYLPVEQTKYTSFTKNDLDAIKNRRKNQIQTFLSQNRDFESYYSYDPSILRCSLMSDDIDRFQAILSKNNISINSDCPPSIYDPSFFPMVSYNNETRTLIEAAALFGSIKIFKFLLLNNARLRPKEIFRRILFGRNFDIFHIAENFILKDASLVKIKKKNYRSSKDPKTQSYVDLYMCNDDDDQIDSEVGDFDDESDNSKNKSESDDDNDNENKKEDKIKNDEEEINQEENEDKSMKKEKIKIKNDKNDNNEAETTEKTQHKKEEDNKSTNNKKEKNEEESYSSDDDVSSESNNKTSHNKNRKKHKKFILINSNSNDDNFTATNSDDDEEEEEEEENKNEAEEDEEESSVGDDDDYIWVLDKNVPSSTEIKSFFSNCMMYAIKYGFDEISDYLYDNYETMFDFEINTNIVSEREVNFCLKNFKKKLLPIFMKYPNDGDEFDNTYLMNATYFNYTDFVKILLRIPGIDVNLVNPRNKTTAMSRAADQHSYKTIEILLKSPLFKYTYDRNNAITPFTKAVAHGYIDEMMLFINTKKNNENDERFADMLNEDELKDAFFLALLRNQGESLKIIMDNFPDYPFFENRDNINYSADKKCWDSLLALLDVLNENKEIYEEKFPNVKTQEIINLIKSKLEDETDWQNK